MDATQLKSLKVDQLIAVYRKLRDRRDEAKAKFVESQKPTLLLMQSIEGELATRMKDQGTESFKCAVGTAFKKITTTVKVKDWGAFFDFVLKTKSFDMLERRAAKGAVEEYVEANESCPPGLDIEREEEVQIRAPKGG